MIPDLTVIRLASRLVDEVNEHGETADVEYRRLVDMAVRNPARVAAMAVALAGMVADLRPPELPRDEVTYQRYLKRAHAAWARGEQAEWVLIGQRAYDRERKKRARERAREARQAVG